MLTHDELIFCIKQEYPHALHGIDFWVLHETDGGVQTKDAFIYEWKLPTPQPSADEIKAMVKKHRAGVPAYLAARDARAERDRRLQEADALVYKAMDAGDMEAMRLAGQYRQALRDVTSQPGFPFNVEWPDAPEQLTGESQTAN